MGWMGGVTDSEMHRCRDGHMKVGVLMDTKDREEGSGSAATFSEEAGGPLIPSSSVWALDRLSGLWDSGQWANRQSQSPISPYTPCCFPPCCCFLAEVYEFHRRQRQCCKLGMQIVLLGLVTAALWAGLLTLLLLWREDIPSPAWSPSCVPSRPPLRSQGAQPTPWSPIPPSCLPPCPCWPLLMSLPPLSKGHSPCSCPAPPHLPPFGHLPHDIPKGAIPRWQVEGGRGT